MISQPFVIRFRREIPKKSTRTIERTRRRTNGEKSHSVSIGKKRPERFWSRKEERKIKSSVPSAGFLGTKFSGNINQTRPPADPKKERKVRIKKNF